MTYPSHYPKVASRNLRSQIILTADTSKESRNASARAFIHSLNILVKYVRLYGFEHKRTEAQFETTWKELQNGLPRGADGGFVLGVSGNTLLLDGIALETGQAERSFAQLLNAAGLASLYFSNQVTADEFGRLVRAFVRGSSKAQDLGKQIKDVFADVKTASIRVNEVKFVAADPETGEISVAAQIAAQSLGPEFKQWLNDPHKLLQLIAAAEGAKGGGGDAGNGVPFGAVPNIRTSQNGGAAAGVAPAAEGAAGAVWSGGVAPLEEEEVIQAIRLLTRFSEVNVDPTAKPESLQAEINKTDANTKINLQQLLEGLAATVPAQNNDTPLLMKAAEHMAIRFALERFQKGDVKVNAVHTMLEHMSRQMDSLRGILKVQEEKMVKAGILTESHADILDRMFWAEVPDSGKKTVLLSNEAHCVPPRNIRQFVEVLLDREDQETAAAILENLSECLQVKEADGRRRAAMAISQLADLYSLTGEQVLGNALHKLSQTLVRDPEPELQGMLSAAFVRLSTEASKRRQFKALNEICIALDDLQAQRPGLAAEMRPRIGLENRLPEFIDEALRQPHAPDDLLVVLRRLSAASAEHLSDRFFRCMRREECDRMVDLAQELGPSGTKEMREMLRAGQTRQAASVIGLLSRLDVPSLLELLPLRLREWNRFYHDLAVRQISYGAAPDRGRTLLELIEYLDPQVLPQVMDEIGMSGDRTVVPPLLVMAESGETGGRPPLIQVKVIESLGRLRDSDALPVLRNLLDAKKMWKFANHRELRIAAAQALTKIDPRFAVQVMADSGLESAELAIAPLDVAPACPWVRQRRYERIALRKSISAVLSSSWGKSNLSVKELSLGGGMGTKDDNMRLGSEANIDISAGVRHIKAQVLLRRAKVNEVGFEIVGMDLESRYRLRRLLMESIETTTDAKGRDWRGDRKN